MQKEFSFLVIGGGSIGKRHIRNLKALGHARIACLKRSQDPAFADEMNVQVITSEEEALAFRPDLVIICTPTSLHLDGIRLAVRLDAAVFAEKPLVHTAEQLKEARELLRDHRKPFFIGFMLRYHPLVRKVHELIDGGSLGPVYSARLEFGSYLPNWHPWEDHRTGYAALTAMGGGVINTISHELDLMLFFFGDPISVYCQSANLGKLEIEAEEIAEALFSYPDKIVSLHLDYLQKDYSRSIRILCDNGSIDFNWRANRITVQAAGKEPEEHLLQDFDVNQLYVDELKDMIGLLGESPRRHPLDLDYALKNTAILLDMHRSAGNGSRVNITNPENNPI
jgi:predicted dehydrogenase